MKKTVSTAMAIILCAGMFAPAMASEESGQTITIGDGSGVTGDFGYDF